MSKHKHKKRGGDLGGPKEKCCGYCRLHKCYMTPRQVKSRECLAKHCRHLRKDPHPYWEQREKRKEMRAARKSTMQAELAKYGK